MKTILLCLVVFSTFMDSTKSQSYISAADPELPVMVPLKSTLVSSSYKTNYRFINPFWIQNVNAYGDLFGYNTSTNSLHFTINRMGNTNSGEQGFYILMNKAEVEFVKAKQTSAQNNENYWASEAELIVPPDNSIFNVLPSATGTMQNLGLAYFMGVSFWSGEVEVEIRLKNPVEKDLIIGLMVVNPNRFNRLSEELIQYFTGPARFLGLMAGESQYSEYVSFANFHIEYDSFDNENCADLILTDSTYLETGCDCLDASQIILNELLIFKDEFIKIQNQLFQTTNDEVLENKLDREIEHLSSKIQTVIEKFLQVMQVCVEIPEQEYSNCDSSLEDLQEQFEGIQFMFTDFVK